MGCESPSRDGSRRSEGGSAGLPLESLAEAGVAQAIYDEVEPKPSTRCVEEGVELFRGAAATAFWVSGWKLHGSVVNFLELWHRGSEGGERAIRKSLNFGDLM